MANEVTISIESSLAAMAYVLADQQKEIGKLRDVAKDLNEKREESERNRLMCLEDSNAMRAEINELRKQLTVYQDKADELIDENEKLNARSKELVEECNEVYGKILKWNPIDEIDEENAYPLGITVEEYPLPCIILKKECIKDGYWDNNNQKVPIGTRIICSEYPMNRDGKYYIGTGDAYMTPVAWCIVTDKNF